MKQNSTQSKNQNSNPRPQTLDSQPPISALQAPLEESENNSQFRAEGPLWAIRNSLFRAEGPLWAIQNLALVSLLALYLIVAMAYAVLAPLTTGPDELAHYEYVRFIADHGRLPLNSEERSQASYKSDQPPLYHLLAALPVALVDPTGPPFLKRVGDHPRRQLIERTRHAWGLYNTEDERWPYRAEVLRWHAGRWVAILFGAATVTVTFFIARDLFSSLPAPFRVQGRTGGGEPHPPTPSPLRRGGESPLPVSGRGRGGGPEGVGDETKANLSVPEPLRGGVVDLRKVPGPEAHSHDDIYLTDLTAGWVAVTNPRLDLTFSLHWDPAVFHWIITWQPYGGAEAMPLAGAYALGIEPWISRLNLEQAVAAGEAIELPGGGLFSTTLRATVGRGNWTPGS